MSERLRSCRRPSQLAHYRDRRISREESLRNYIGRPSSEQVKACSDILSDAMSGRPRRSQQRSITALSLQAIFMFLWIRLSFILNTQALCSLFSKCHGKKTCAFLWATIRPDFTEHFTFRFMYLKLQKLQANVLISTCRTLSICELLQIVTFDGLWTLMFWNF